jgi:uncharacterized damage-inducible protein DinB
MHSSLWDLKKRKMGQVKWFNREFNFVGDQNIFPSIIERLTGTPIRLEEKLKRVDPGTLTVRFDDTWSIKENIGHLTDLEPLWQGRLEDITLGKSELRPTDLQNTRTSEANHNSMPTEQLLTEFREIRKKTIDLIEGLDEKTIFKSSLHPRLKTPMRTMDLFLFVADHDDHHLARITQLMRMNR